MSVTATGDNCGQSIYPFTESLPPFTAQHFQNSIVLLAAWLPLLLLVIHCVCCIAFLNFRCRVSQDFTPHFGQSTNRQSSETVLKHPQVIHNGGQTDQVRLLETETALGCSPCFRIAIVNSDKVGARRLAHCLPITNNYIFCPAVQAQGKSGREYTHKQ